MSLPKFLVASAGVVAMLGVNPAFAQSPQNAQSLDNECVSRDGQSGTWRTNPAGKWVRCKPVGRPAAAGRGVNTALAVGGLAVAVGLAAGLGSGKGSGRSASP